MDEAIEILYRVIHTLDSIDVRGRENLNALLGSIQAVEKVHAALVEAKKQAAETANAKD